MESQNLPIDEDVRTLGNKAAYSKDEISDDDRRYMLNRLVEIKKEKKADEKRKKKLAGHHMHHDDFRDGNVDGQLQR